MVNIGFGWSSLLGIALAVAGAALYFLRSVQPRLARDHDIFFAAVGLICGGILFFQGWRLDPILQFGQFLLAGSTIFFAVESIRLRGVTTLQAKRSVPDIVDDDRPVSKAYRVEAELDELEAEDELPPRRRIRGTQESRSSRSQVYEDEERRPPSRSRSADRPGPEDQPRKRRPRPASGPTPSRADEWNASIDEEETPSGNNSTRTVTRSPSEASRRKKRRPPEEAAKGRSRNEVEAQPTDYVEYQPVDPSEDDDTDNSNNFDY